MTELTEKLSTAETAVSANLGKGGLGFLAGLVLSAAALAFQGAVLYAIAQRKK